MNLIFMGFHMRFPLLKIKLSINIINELLQTTENNSEGNKMKRWQSSLKINFGLWVLSLGILLCVPAFADTPQHDFVGVKKCSICHKKDEQGNQFGIWQGTKHAKAYEVLGTPAAIEAGKKKGVDNPQTSGKCLKCHSTAYYFSEAKVTEDIPVEEGVS